MPLTRIGLLFVLPILLASSASLAQQAHDANSGSSSDESKIVEKYRESASKTWEKAIRALEELDEEEEYSDNAILFTGSSSIRRWDSISKDMAPWESIRRGYGGARFSDLAVYIDRIIASHQVQAVVIFVGNDIAGSEKDKTPAEAVALYRYIVGRIRLKLPKVPVFCIGVTPTSSRFEVWPKVQKMNRLLKEFSASKENLHYIDTAAEYLDGNGQPRDELFVKDRLHLNADGYKLWAKLIKAELSKVLVGN